ncbi:hypothetical protein R3W88_026143 [Solanum pinnatisectum]|uniref:RNase III domain-containing protein n=1 Tax=Solanum pinnatisectum TaxID=50273 RepID=A0AAV9LF11_9SOLN|nr:hypothetical protein R3W88_026143 [Solanum pinnatisectum]
MLAEKLISMTAEKVYQIVVFKLPISTASLLISFSDLSYKSRYSQKLGTLIFSSCPEKKPSTSALLSEGTKKQKFEPPTHTKKQSVFFPGKARSPCVLVPPENCAVVTDGNRKLLENALTRSSCPNSASNYQQLAFIGNAALGLAISSYFFVTYPDVDCGKLTDLSAADIVKLITIVPMWNCNSGDFEFNRLAFIGNAALGLAISRYFFVIYPDVDCDKLTDLSAADVSTEKLVRVAVRQRLYKCLSCDSAILDEKEIVSIYPGLSSPSLAPAQSSRVCNAIALLQSVVSHPDTRKSFLNAKIPLYLYPFLNTTSKSTPFEYLRLASLGVICALVKVDDTEVISFLISTEIIPKCLCAMEMGCELSKTVATFIVQKILLDDVGLNYVCAISKSFFEVIQVLGNMVGALAEQPSSRLLKHIIRCFLRLSDNPRACLALKVCLPNMLRDNTFSRCLREDSMARSWLLQLLLNVNGNRVAPQAGGFDHML